MEAGKEGESEGPAPAMAFPPAEGKIVILRDRFLSIITGETRCAGCLCTSECDRISRSDGTLGLS